MIGAGTEVWLALIVAMPALLVSLATFINTIRNGTAIKANDVKTDALGVSVNGRMDELMTASNAVAASEATTVERDRGSAVAVKLAAVTENDRAITEHDRTITEQDRAITMNEKGITTP